MKKETNSHRTTVLDCHASFNAEATLSLWDHLGQDPTYEEVKEDLLAGADPNATDTDGTSVLVHGILINAPVEALRALLDGGSDPDLKDDAKKTPYDYLGYHKNKDLHVLLDKHSKACDPLLLDLVDLKFSSKEDGENWAIRQIENEDSSECISLEGYSCRYCYKEYGYYGICVGYDPDDSNRSINAYVDYGVSVGIFVDKSPNMGIENDVLNTRKCFVKMAGRNAVPVKIVFADLVPSFTEGSFFFVLLSAYSKSIEPVDNTDDVGTIKQIDENKVLIKGVVKRLKYVDYDLPQNNGQFFYLCIETDYGLLPLFVPDKEFERLGNKLFEGSIIQANCQLIGNPNNSFLDSNKVQFSQSSINNLLLESLELGSFKRVTKLIKDVPLFIDNVKSEQNLESYLKKAMPYTPERTWLLDNNNPNYDGVKKGTQAMLLSFEKSKNILIAHTEDCEITRIDICNEEDFLLCHSQDAAMNYLRQHFKSTRDNIMVLGDIGLSYAMDSIGRYLPLTLDSGNNMVPGPSRGKNLFIVVKHPIIVDMDDEASHFNPPLESDCTILTSRLSPSYMAFLPRNSSPFFQVNLYSSNFFCRKIEFFEDPAIVDIDSINTHELIVLLGGGIVNPMGPTLTIFALYGIRVLYFIINPIRTTVLDIGLITGTPVSITDFYEPLFDYYQGSMPSLLLNSRIFKSKVEAEEVYSQWLMRFTRASSFYESLEKYPDPYERIDKEMTEKVADSKPIRKDQALKLAKRLLDTRVFIKEINAFCTAYDGSIMFANMYSPMKGTDTAKGNFSTVKDILTFISYKCNIVVV